MSAKRKFNLCAKVTVSAFTEIEAESLEQAIELSTGRECQIDGYGNNASECWIVSDVDGVPFEIEGEA